MVHHNSFYLARKRKDLVRDVYKFLREEINRVSSLSRPIPSSFVDIDDRDARSDVRDLLPEDVGGGEEALGDEHRVPSVPLLTLERWDHRSRWLILVLLLHPVVSYDPERDRGYVKRVRYEVDHVPHVVHVLLQAHVPQLFHLRPDQPRHPGQYKPTDYLVLILITRTKGKSRQIAPVRTNLSHGIPRLVNRSMSPQISFEGV